MPYFFPYRKKEIEWKKKNCDLCKVFFPNFSKKKTQNTQKSDFYPKKSVKKGYAFFLQFNLFWAKFFHKKLRNIIFYVCRSSTKNAFRFFWRAKERTSRHGEKNSLLRWRTLYIWNKKLPHCSTPKKLCVVYRTLPNQKKTHSWFFLSDVFVNCK